jgi:hypothetical protein
MHDDASVPAVLPAPSGEAAAPPAWRRVALLLGIGGGIGLALGILLSTAVFTTYALFTFTVPPSKESVRVFKELNELRQQINELNEERKLTESGKDESLRQALAAVASTVRAPEDGRPGLAYTAKKQVRHVPDGFNPFADIDAEIERLEHTQKVLNTILDLFTPDRKERARDRHVEKRAER